MIGFAGFCMALDYSRFSTPGRYYFYIDGVMTNKIDASQEDFLGVCDTETYMKITAEFGSWGGLVNLSLMPDALVVDYIRAYKEA